MKREWTKVPGTLYLDMEVEFHSSGFYDSGRVYGPPEDCYPPEDEDERTIVSIEIDGVSVKGELLEKLKDLIYNHRQDKLNEVEIDTYDEPYDWP